MPPKKSKKKTTKKAPAPAKETQPPALGRGVTRGASNRSRNTRGMFGADNSMMLRSVLNSMNNLPSTLQKHVDERMERIHKDLLFRADERRRNDNVTMDWQRTPPPPPPPPEVPMEDVPQPPPPPATPMETEMGANNSAPPQAPPPQPPPPTRDPLMRRQVAASSSALIPINNRPGTAVFEGAVVPYRASFPRVTGRRKREEEADGNEEEDRRPLMYARTD